MEYRIGKRFSFDAAHHLEGLASGHKCARVHGHTYAVEVVLAADHLSGPGFVADFGDLAPFRDFLEKDFDHRDLNEVMDVPPTSELIATHLAHWFIDNLEPLI